MTETNGINGEFEVKSGGYPSKEKAEEALLLFREFNPVGMKFDTMQSEVYESLDDPSSWWWRWYREFKESE